MFPMSSQVFLPFSRKPDLTDWSKDFRRVCFPMIWHGIRLPCLLTWFNRTKTDIGNKHAKQWTADYRLWHIVLFCHHIGHQWVYRPRCEGLYTDIAQRRLATPSLRPPLSKMSWYGPGYEVLISWGHMWHYINVGLFSILICWNHYFQITVNKYSLLRATHFCHYKAFE